MPVVLICGGSGLIGQRLTTMLIEKGYEVIIVTRSSQKSRHAAGNPSYALWDTEKETIDASAISRADYIINLAGAGIADKRWTAKRKKEITNSRVQSAGTVIKALQQYDNKVKAVISSSAIGWYGEDDPAKTDKKFTEEDPPAPGFLGDTCKAWEESIAPVKALGKRLAILRTGIVLSNKGGALSEFVKPVKFGIAAILGSGKQVVSWIHIDDLCRIFIYAIENESLHGIYNAVAPLPADNRSLTIAIAKKIKGSFFITAHVPSFILKLMLGELSTEVLKSTTVSSSKLRATGFQFIYPSVEAALQQLG
jgi:uncharacterized protein (TIGR01777 family)